MKTGTRQAMEMWRLWRTRMSEKSYTIRRARLSDIPDILRLLVQVNMVHHNDRPDLFKGPTTKYTDEELADIFGNDEKPVFVYEDQRGRVLGHAFCVICDTSESNLLTGIRTLYIDDLCVDENARGKDIGKRLCEHVWEYARSIDCYNVTLTVWAENKSAIGFYENIGFKCQKLGMEVVLDR